MWPFRKRNFNYETIETMPTTPQPNLGYGKPTEATIDQVNQWMRAQPWYQDQMRAWGQDPGHPTLTKDQSKQILRAAQAQGVIVDEGNMEVDNHGNFNPKGHKLRNTLIVAGIAGATLATMGAAGAFGGAAAGGAGGASGAAGAATAAGGVLPSTTIGVGFIPGVGLAGGGGLTAAGGGLAGLASSGGAAAASHGFGGALTAAERLARIGQGLGQTAGAIANRGIDPSLSGNAAANAAAQAAYNRIAGTSINQAGPGADKTALSNARMAGLMSSFKDTGVSPFGSPAIVLNQNTRDIASQFQDELARRAKAGLPLTTFGVPEPGAQELADEQRARMASEGRTGNATADAIATGGRIAGLIPGVVRNVQDFYGIFRGR